MKTILYLTFTLLFSTSTIYSFSQILTDFPCYSVSSGEQPNVLFEYNPIIDEWTEVGITGGTNIDAIATDPITGIIYATDAGTFGTLNANTGLFNPIGEVGIGNGEAGLIELNDVDGLTYDPINQIMYATHRVISGGSGTNDLLFQIDVATGKVKPGAMRNSENNPIDYAIIPDVFDNSDCSDLYDVDDIAYNIYTGQLFANQTQYAIPIITELNPVNGQVKAVIYDLPDDDVQGLGFTYLGELYGTTGNNGTTLLNSNVFIFIDLAAGSTTTLTFIDETMQQSNFAAFDCFTAYNDLALKMEVDVNTQQPVNIGEMVSFVITIYNQGNFSNSDITITNYIPNGLILSDAAWIDLGNGIATYTINQSIEPDTSFDIPISFIVDPNFKEASLINTAEIKSSFNPDITDIYGNPLLLPDWDSKPDNENNEVNISDNEINEGGPRAIDNQDEDDHDIAVLQVNNLPVDITINPELCNTLGSAQIEIILNEAPPFSYQWKDAKGSVIHQGFTSHTVYTIYNQASGKYTITVMDKLNKKSSFEVIIPFLSALDGNDNCNDPCPEYLVVPEGEMYGNFKAKEIIEIKGEVKKTKTALFSICE